MNVFDAMGLTDKERAVYSTLLQLKQTSTGPLYKQAGVSQSKVYEILYRLKRKGLAICVMKGRVNYWSPANPQIFLDSISEELTELQKRRELLEKELPALTKLTSSAPDEAKVYVGFAAYKQALNSLLLDFKKGDSFRIFGSPKRIPQKYFRFLRHYNNECKTLSIHVRLIYGEEMISFAKKQQEEFDHFDIRVIKGVTPTTTAIGNKNVLLFSYKEPVNIVIINSLELVSNYKNFFDQLWDQTKTI